MEAEWESERHLSSRNPIHCNLTCLEKGYEHMIVRFDHSASQTFLNHQYFLNEIEQNRKYLRYHVLQG